MSTRLGLRDPGAVADRRRRKFSRLLPLLLPLHPFLPTIPPAPFSKYVSSSTTVTVSLRSARRASASLATLARSLANLGPGRLPRGPATDMARATSRGGASPRGPPRSGSASQALGSARFGLTPPAGGVSRRRTQARPLVAARGVPGLSTLVSRAVGVPTRSSAAFRATRRGTAPIGGGRLAGPDARRRRAPTSGPPRPASSINTRGNHAPWSVARSLVAPRPWYPTPSATTTGPANLDDTHDRDEPPTDEGHTACAQMWLVTRQF